MVIPRMRLETGCVGHKHFGRTIQQPVETLEVKPRAPTQEVWPFVVSVAEASPEQGNIAWSQINSLFFEETLGHHLPRPNTCEIHESRRSDELGR
jgi:hypothetical protein